MSKKPKELKKEEVEVREVSEPVLETRTCTDCQGDGKWDGVLCELCQGSGKIFKDGTVVTTVNGSFMAQGGKLVKQ